MVQSPPFVFVFLFILFIYFIYGPFVFVLLLFKILFWKLPKYPKFIPWIRVFHTNLAPNRANQLGAIQIEIDLIRVARSQQQVSDIRNRKVWVEWRFWVLILNGNRTDRIQTHGIWGQSHQCCFIGFTRNKPSSTLVETNSTNG